MPNALLACPDISGLGKFIFRYKIAVRYYIIFPQNKKKLFIFDFIGIFLYFCYQIRLK